MASPLADVLRPQTLNEVLGQKHILAENGVLAKVAGGKIIPNMVFYGPSGVGKTTVARIISHNAGKKLVHLNGTTASTGDLREITEQLDTLEGRKGVLLYLDEIQYLNKKQQQSLLEYMENGTITLIASTTENPYFYIYNAVLSRAVVFEFKPLAPEEVLVGVNRAFEKAKELYGTPFTVEEGVGEQIAGACGGDVRKAINTVEILSLAAVSHTGALPVVTFAQTLLVTGSSANRYDRNGDMHYDILSAFQKSIRGSDENAALHYLARLLEAGDLLSVCRRLLVTASEDIGLAYPMAITIVKSCVDSALQLGLPEAQMPLAQAVILLSTAPKSNTASAAIGAAWKDVKGGKAGNIPDHIRDGHYAGAQKLGRAQGYQYPHAFKNNFVKQQYLPDEICDKQYYTFGKNKTEQAAEQYRLKLLEEWEPMPE